MHERRNFYEDRATDRPRAELVLAKIGQLYAVERDLKVRCTDECRDLPRVELEDRIADARQERSVPILTTLHAWLEAEKPKLLPKAAPGGRWITCSIIGRRWCGTPPMAHWRSTIAQPNERCAD
jgi:hypothetical protein